MEHISFLTILLSLCLGIAVAFAAYKLGSLSKSGALAAVFVGASIFALTGWKGSIALLAFFITGSLMTRIPTKRKMELVEGKAGREWDQVLANGVVPVAACYCLLNDSIAPFASYAFMGALATATADTWATEIGSRFANKTYDPLNLHTFQIGRSGGISVPGLFASLGGAVFIALIAMPQMRDNYLTLEMLGMTFVVITLAGFLGAYLDSILGRIMQAVFTCNECNSTIEVSTHCGRDATLIKGVKLIDNSMVNLLATLGGSSIAAGLASYWIF